MKLVLHKNFVKTLKKLDQSKKQQVTNALIEFAKDPHSPSLRNHALHGQMSGKRSISASNNLRIIFEQLNGYTLVLLLDVGTHEQVY